MKIILEKSHMGKFFSEYFSQWEGQNLQISGIAM